LNNNKIETVNPATEEIIQEYEIITKEQIDDRVKKAQNTFQDWKKLQTREPISFMILLMN
jgi:succinate-semialdehyde dehydrogenase/glutarate-semialdehyde dehydrogenase/succinyl-CoA reductase